MKTESEKTEALFYFVQEKVRYIAADLDRGGLRPHLAEGVWASRYGDCKDQTMLLVALLRSVGIEAYPALVNTFGGGTLNVRVPTLHFSHMITYVPNADSGMWLDTSGDTTAFPGLDWTIEDRWAFVIDGAGGMLLKIPATGPEDNQVRIDIDFRFSGQSLFGHLSLETSGTISDRLKAMLGLNPKRDEVLRTFVKSVSSKAHILEIAFPRLGDPRAPFVATARFELSEAWEPGQEFTQSIGLVSMLSNFTELLTLPPPRARSTDYYLGVRRQLTQETRHAAPSEAYEGNIFSASRIIETPHFSFIKSVTRTGSGITSRQRVTLNRTTVGREDYKEFYENVQRMLSQSDVNIAFKKRKTTGATVASTGSVSAADGKGPSGLLQRARTYLRTARYAEARSLVEGVLADDPRNGEAHYLLGVALGHLDKYQASAAAFKKARGLGYRP